MNRSSSNFVRGLIVLVVSLAPISTMPAQEQSLSTSDAKLEEMIAGGKSQKELAQYLFNTHACKNCHTVGHDGKLGFTAKGTERAKGFEGCINMLTAMTVIVQVADDKRSPEQRLKAQRFQEFGCTDCHRLTPGKLDLTEIGAKLQHLHLGCVDVEKVVASARPAEH